MASYIVAGWFNRFQDAPRDNFCRPIKGERGRDAAGAVAHGVVAGQAKACEKTGWQVGDESRVTQGIGRLMRNGRPELEPESSAAATDEAEH